MKHDHYKNGLIIYRQGNETQLICLKCFEILAEHKTAPIINDDMDLFIYNTYIKKSVFTEFVTNGY